MTISNEAVEKALSAGLSTHDWGMFEAQQGDMGEAVDEAIRAALEAAAPIIRAECLEEAAKELSQLAYVRPDHPDRAEYQRMIGIRRGNTDDWLRARALAERGRQ